MKLLKDAWNGVVGLIVIAFFAWLVVMLPLSYLEKQWKCQEREIIIK